MDAISAIAAAGQFVSYINHIVGLLLELRDEIKEGPLRLREKCDYLDSFIFVLQSIQDHLSLQDPKVKAQIDRLEERVITIRSALQRYLDAIGKSGTITRRVLLAISVVKAKEKFLRSFEALDEDRGLLNFYITAASGETIHQLASQEKMQSTPRTGETTPRPPMPFKVADEGYGSDDASTCSGVAAATDRVEYSPLNPPSSPPPSMTSNPNPDPNPDGQQQAFRQQAILITHHNGQREWGHGANVTFGHHIQIEGNPTPIPREALQQHSTFTGKETFGDNVTAVFGSRFSNTMVSNNLQSQGSGGGGDRRPNMNPQADRQRERTTPQEPPPTAPTASSPDDIDRSHSRDN
ncbi:hypothetical protein A1O3_03852 [Capronia epimyces CBS 606.96]|uniref:Uncharacterized protein n=1 Tax=Capronia epimyces CBS 606.96 TaxID=1182542 RepID=W9Y341_9EURO|nr:uncharacterized protein A1O3_03852 [Capronia epimyces CBS 606.96]EXJ86898.1 hypothetical protein A1O3_03852 [Capronia epimyces CBS 606.96]